MATCLYSPPSARKPSSTARHAERAIKNPLSGSWIAQRTSSTLIWGQRFSTSFADSFSYAMPASRSVGSEERSNSLSMDVAIEKRRNDVEGGGASEARALSTGVRRERPFLCKAGLVRRCRG